ncbi:hypothetical protein G7Y89_g2096 [Cudoniella acicularis]|uniref:Aminoglycoside phosphotransferase domain-containing protein n=1 Tax=Cudoniella acicularis TaxID=354080 RepID=A0A8H4RU01_9HELO|nr:hypothetical protein G7Y89_g2096 [Cudoniella acicularis]
MCILQLLQLLQRLLFSDQHFDPALQTAVRNGRPILRAVKITMTEEEQKQQHGGALPEASLSIGAFFTRNNLTANDRAECNSFVSQLYPGKSSSLPSCQGYCSLTVFVGDDIVVQFRPNTYRLDLSITTTASKIHPEFAPITQYITTIPSSGLLVYRMSRIPGISLRDFRRSSPLLAYSTQNLTNLCISFADFLAQSWHHANQPQSSLPLGTIGLSIETRLKALRATLPARFRTLAKTLLMQLPRITSLPWLFTHGDLMPGNFMLEPSTGVLRGLVDWAESEYLPFGICFYGLEEILGELTPNGFLYHPDANTLREIFWKELEQEIPELRDDVKSNVIMARDLGVLLWYGIAFDDGAVNRVVEEGRDVPEIWKLDAFLSPEQGEENTREHPVSAERISKI